MLTDPVQRVNMVKLMVYIYVVDLKRMPANDFNPPSAMLSAMPLNHINFVQNKNFSVAILSACSCKF